MPSFDDRLRQGLIDLADRPDSTRAFEEVTSRKTRRRLLRRLQVVTLATAVIIGTVVGTYGLLRAFRQPPVPDRAGASPSNGRIAFVRGGPRDEMEIVTVDPDGGGKMTIWRGSGNVRSLSWSPDGSRLAFDRSFGGLGNHDSEIYVVTADGNEAVQLTNNEAEDSSPSWSPDGRLIAFLSDRDGDGEILLMSPNGGNVRPATQTLGVDPGCCLTWSPDSKRIAFSGGQGRDDQGDIYTIELGASAAIRLTDDPQLDIDPSWSPDGSMIVFRSRRGATGSGHREGDPAPDEIYLMSDTGLILARLTGNEDIEQRPSWSPNGRLILFHRISYETSERGLQVSSGLWTMKPDGSDQRMILRNAGGAPSWQPLINDSVGPKTTLTGGIVFSNGELLRFTPEGTEVFATLPEKIAPVPPVLTSYGVVVLTGGPSVGLRLWLVSADGSVNEIADEVTGGFAVDPVADVVAYATTRMDPSPPHYRSTVHVVSLPDGKEQATSPELDRYVEVGGIADDKVVLSTGDGASSSVGLWVTVTQEIRRYWSYGRVEGTDPLSGISVLEVGDGGSPILVRFVPAPPGADVGMIPGEIVIDPTVLQFTGVDFHPGSRLVAGLQPTSDGVELIALDEESGEVAFRTSLPGGAQTVWSEDDSVLVLDKDGPGARVRQCDRSGDCVIAAEDLPSAGEFGYGLWLVRGSFNRDVPAAA